MKTLLLCRLLAALALCLFSAGFVTAAEKSDVPAKPIGSIRPTGKPAPKDLPALAKIDFKEAMTAALTRIPGNIIKAELEIEDGNLQYSFEIVGADKSVTEVEVDAGNGKILDVDKEDGGKKD